MSVLSHKKKQLVKRVKVGGYYADGATLVKVTGLGSTPCVLFTDCRTGYERCLSIEAFREQFWLVKMSELA